MIFEEEPIPVFGFHGPKGAGKTTAAAMAKLELEELGYTVIIDSYADPIRQFTKAVYGLSTLTDNKASHHGFAKSVRDFMQLCGTEFGREMIQEDLWLKSLEIRVHQKLTHEQQKRQLFRAGANQPLYRRDLKPALLIHDVRFENEATHIKSHGGWVVKIAGRDDGDETTRGHKSEAGIPMTLISGYYENSGTLLDLREWIGTFMATRLLPKTAGQT